jgi:hypothetical protein
MADHQELGIGGGDDGPKRGFQGNLAYLRFTIDGIMDKEFGIVKIDP